MSRWGADPDAAAQALIESALDALDVAGRAIAANAEPALTAALSAGGATVTAWTRRQGPGCANVSPWPPDGPFDLALLRLPKAKDEQLMTIHALLNVLAAAGRLIIYGGNDEGIKSVAKLADAVATDIVTVAARGHGRILSARRPADPGVLKSTLAAWRQTGSVMIAGTARAWCSYPGVFADGHLDPGTALLLQHLPACKPGARVLDYGCGTGIIAAHILVRDPSAVVTMLDNDSAALVAAGENVPAASTVLAAAVDGAGTRQFDLIISNPPIHTGISENHAALAALITGAPRRLIKGGALVMVVQRRIALQDSLAERFTSVDILADDGRYRVWRAR